MLYSTIKSSSGLSLNFSETTRRVDINYSGGGLLTVKKEEKNEEEKKISYLDNYLEDVSALEESFDVNFFNTLSTPVDEDKQPQFIKEEVKEFEETFNEYSRKFGSQGNQIKFNSYLDFGKFQDLTDLVDNPRNCITFNTMDDSLATPVIDPNSSIMNNGPFYSMPSVIQSTEDYVCGSPDDICGSFTLPSTVSNTVNNQMNPPSTHANITTVTTNVTSFNINQNTAPINFVQPQPKTDNYYGSVNVGSYTYSTASSTPSTTPSLTPSVTPSSSSSSLVYTELQPRSISTPDLMPTVINDHPYFSTRANSFSRTVPSPCPSTSSMASSSTIDAKDFLTRLSLEASSNAGESNDEPQQRQMYTSVRRKNNEASKKSRVSKKQKLSDMLEQLHTLEVQNENYKKECREKEAVVNHLRNYLMNIMRNGMKK